MPSIVAALLYIGGLAMFWLYYRISLDQSPAPDEPQAQALADEYGEVLTDEEHELLRSADEAHRQHHLDEDGMVLDCWERGKEPACPAI